MEQSTVALIIVLVAAICFVTRIIPFAVTAVGASLAMAIAGIISFPTAFAGFSSDVTIMVIGASIVGDAIFETGAAQILGSTLLKLCGNSERRFLLVTITVSAIASAFTSNLAVVMMFLPIASAAAASSGGLITKKNTYMAIGFASMIGGGLTLVGSPPNLIGQGFLINAGLEPMQFFDLALMGLPRFIAFIIFYATFGYGLQKRVFNFPEEIPELPASSENEIAKPVNSFKVWLPVLIMAAMVVAFISQLWTTGACAMVAGLLCIVTGCIPVKKAFTEMDWTTVWVLAGGLGFATGITQSGAGELIALTVISWFGANLSFFTLLVALTVVGVLLVNLITASTVILMLTPIALTICTEMGYDGKSMVMALVMILNLPFINPVAMAPVTATLPGGYRFSDYVKVGGILTVIMMIVTIATFYFMYA